MYKQVEFTREALYQKVWERPVLVLAREIGVSDVALAKACRKAGVPLPARGHWARIKVGRTITTPALPAPKPGQSETVVFTVMDSPPPKPVKVEAPPGPRIEIPTELIKPHRLVAELNAAAKGRQEDKGVIPFNYHEHLRVRTSVAQLQRALILMDTLVKQFEGKGYKVLISEKNGETELVLREGVVTFRLDERTKRILPPPPPPRPPGRRGEYYREPWQPAYVLVGTGEFTLEFGKYQINRCPNTWKDRANRPLEAQLPEVIAVLPSWEAELLADRREREEREAEEQEAEKRRIAAARAEEILRLQRAKLVNHLLAWEHAERLRHFIAAFEHKGDQSPASQAWLEWANLQVQDLDPMCSSLKAITNPRVEISDYFTGRGSWDKQPRDWWSAAPKVRSLLELAEDSEGGLEEGATEDSISSQRDDSGTEPEWHPNQWYTRLHR